MKNNETPNGALGALVAWLRADELGYCAKELRVASLERLLGGAVNEHAALCRVAGPDYNCDS